MSDYTTEFVTGTLYWAKIVGSPVDNYERTGREWTVDFVPDDTTFLKKHGLLDRLKEAKEPISGPFIRLRKPELNKDDEKNDPITIYTADNQPWDGSKIGNGSKADAKLTIADWGRGKKKSIWVKALRITDHVPFEVDEFAGMGSPSVTRTVKDKAKPLSELDELDDEVPPFD
jgi:hypothetical protein